jgi:hypothetical protein
MSRPDAPPSQEVLEAIAEYERIRRHPYGSHHRRMLRFLREMLLDEGVVVAAGWVYSWSLREESLVRRPHITLHDVHATRPSRPRDVNPVAAICRQSTSRRRGVSESHRGIRL